LDRIKCPQRGRHKRFQITEAICHRAKNHESNPPTTEVLLSWHVLVHGYDDVETGSLGCGYKVAVPQACESSVAGGLAVVIAKQMPQPLIDTFIE
jgi:hypothetical protein